jgi:hypothetical protein
VTFGRFAGSCIPGPDATSGELLHLIGPIHVREGSADTCHRGGGVFGDLIASGMGMHAGLASKGAQVEAPRGLTPKSAES